MRNFFVKRLYYLMNIAFFRLEKNGHELIKVHLRQRIKSWLKLMSKDSTNAWDQE